MSFAAPPFDRDFGLALLTRRCLASPSSAFLPSISSPSAQLANFTFLSSYSGGVVSRSVEETALPTLQIAGTFRKRPQQAGLERPLFTARTLPCLPNPRPRVLTLLCFFLRFLHRSALRSASHGRSISNSGLQQLSANSSRAIQANLRTNPHQVSLFIVRTSFTLEYHDSTHAALDTAQRPWRGCLILPRSLPSHAARPPPPVYGSPNHLRNFTTWN